MKVVVIAGLTNGRYIIEYLKNSKSTDLTKIFVLRDELGKNISDFVLFDDLVEKDVLVKVENINEHEEEISEINPDLIFVVGFSQLISKTIINSAKIGVIGFHPSKLPKDRGRSVLAWQISEGYTTGCVSMFWIDEGIDSGDIIGQKDFKIEYEDTIRDVLDKVYDTCLELTKTYYPLILKNHIIRIKQDDSQATYRRKRVKEDGIIKWNSSSNNIYNLIRAITEPYPGAIAFYDDQEIIVLEAEEWKLNGEYKRVLAGTIIGFLLDRGMIVKAKDEAVLIKKVKIGDRYISRNELANYFRINERLK